jgi:hypothetical protein
MEQVADFGPHLQYLHSGSSAIDGSDVTEAEMKKVG